MKIPNILELLKAGLHFGHKTSKWHPSMAKFILGERKDVHIIDLKQSIECLKTALEFIQKTISEGGIILLVGTKEQAKEKIKEVSQEVKMPYVNNKWISGTITNWPVVKKQILKLKKRREEKQKNEWSKYTKKEQLLLQKELEKLEQLYGGIADLEKMPDTIFILDCKENKTAIHEANLKKVPIIAVCDTDVNVKKITYPIPANDDAIKSINFILDLIKDSILEAQKLRNTQHNA
ncbi:MAG: 30S ribosomal protein S2 [Candidatus Jacksonbacteria bacterium]